MIHGKIEFSGESDGDVELAIEAGSVRVVTCKHCGRVITQEQGCWVDPQATGDDSVWRETCDAHDTTEAEHEPQLEV